MDPDDDSLRKVPDKKFYVAMDFNRIDNFHFNVPGLYPLSAVVRQKQLLSPQMNHISFTLPPVPPLTQFEDLNEEVSVGFSYGRCRKAMLGVWCGPWLEQSVKQIEAQTVCAESRNEGR